jgi:hypothetical protein
MERTHCVVDLGRSHFDTELDEGGGSGHPTSGEGPQVIVGNLEDAIREAHGPFDLVIVDGRALDAVGGATSLSERARGELLDLLAEGGAIAWGPKAAHHPRTQIGSGWEVSRHDRRDPLEEVLVMRRRTDARSVTAGGDRGSVRPP